MQKYKSYEYLAIDILYNDKDAETVAVLPRDYPDVHDWIRKNIEHPKVNEHCFVYTYPVTLQ